jgi:hypothetical protein
MLFLPMSISADNEMRPEMILKPGQDRANCHAMLHKEQKVKRAWQRSLTGVMLPVS